MVVPVSYEVARTMLDAAETIVEIDAAIEACARALAYRALSDDASLNPGRAGLP